MISAWHLAWIIPLTVILSIVCIAVVSAGRDDRP